MTKGVAEATGAAAVAAARSSSGAEAGLVAMVEAARQSNDWPALVDAVVTKAESVGSDLKGIWNTLERGRLDWLRATSGVHQIKMTLRKALKKDNAMESVGDVSDAKMIWIYCLCLNLENLKPAALVWADLMGLADPNKPLDQSSYKPELWDPRKDQWRPLDLGAQAAAEAGGSSIEEAWNAE